MDKKDVIITIKVDNTCDMAVVSDSLGYVYSGNFWDFHNGCHTDVPELKTFNTYRELANRLKDKHISNGYNVDIIEETYSFQY